MPIVNIAALTQELESLQAPWAARENEITALSSEEFERLLGYNPPPESGELPLDVRELMAAAPERIRALEATGSTAPASFDLRNVGGRNFITAVRNQLGCGSCVSFGVIGAVEGTMRFSRNDPGFTIDLSEGHLFNCIARGQGRTCANGWWVDPAMRALRDQGVVDEACSPYSPQDVQCTLCGDAGQRLVRILSYKEIRNVNEMKDWLSTKGPISACFSVYTDFSAYSSGVYRRTPNATFRGGHCVVVVGYSDAERAWICKNSWGTGWGERGFFKIGYGECGIDAAMWGVQTGATPTPSGAYVPLYRYWNGGNADHFYTTSWAELGEGRYGWGYEGVQCFVSSTQTSGLVPLYRYWNPDIGDHFYTTSWDELGGGKYGWGYEGVQCYVASTQLPGTVPLHRYWNPGGGDHFYTTSWDELGGGKYGWGYEGVQCYVWTGAAGSNETPATFRTSAPTSGQAPSSFQSTGITSVPSSFQSAGSPQGIPGSFQRTPGDDSKPSSFKATAATKKCGCSGGDH